MEFLEPFEGKILHAGLPRLYDLSVDLRELPWPVAREMWLVHNEFALCNE